MRIRAISLHQPHASFVSTGAKRFETRGWSTKYRGPLLIHAALRRPVSELLHNLAFWHVQGALAPLVGKPLDLTAQSWPGVQLEHLPFGAIVAVCEVTACFRTNDMTLEMVDGHLKFGDFSLGRYAWQLENVRRFVNPVPYLGRQGFFSVEINLSEHELRPITR